MKFAIGIGFLLGVILILVLEITRATHNNHHATAAIKSLGSVQRGAADSALDSWEASVVVESRDNRIIDRRTGLAGVVPAGWTMRTALSRGDKEVSIMLATNAHATATITLYCRMVTSSAAQTAMSIDERLANAVKTKTTERLAAGFRNYKLREPQTRLSIAGSPALAWSAEYSRENTLYCEHFTRVENAACVVLGFLAAPAAEADKLREAFDSFMQSITLPSLR